MQQPLCTIVGMGRGISLAVARRFVREGFAIAMIARRAEALERLAAQLQQEGGKALPFPADAGDFATLAGAMAQIHQRLGTTEVLVYNVAVPRQELPSRLDPEKLVAEFGLNVAAALVAAQQVIPHMKTRQRGTILFTGGGLALEPYPQYASLAVGKSGLRSLCFSLATELRPAGIHVATVTISGLVKSGTRLDPDLIAQHYWTLYTQEPGNFDREIIVR